MDRSSTGQRSVMTMSLETMAMLRSNCGNASAIQAFSASTSFFAVTLPQGVRTRTLAPAS